MATKQNLVSRFRRRKGKDILIFQFTYVRDVYKLLVYIFHIVFTIGDVLYAFMHTYIYTCIIYYHIRYLYIILNDYLLDRWASISMWVFYLTLSSFHSPFLFRYILETITHLFFPHETIFIFLNGRSKEFTFSFPLFLPFL